MMTISHPYQQVQERGTLKCFLLALFMHMLLGLMLYYGVHWQSRTPAGVEAELWDSVPEIAQPQPVVQPTVVQPVVQPTVFQGAVVTGAVVTGAVVEGAVVQGAVVGGQPIY